MSEFLIIKKKPEPTYVFDTYWRFTKERQDIFFNRFYNATNLTNNPILQTYKFTNVYRASDRVSQYLIRNVIYQGEQSPEEVLFRILIFKIFNKVETWEYLRYELDHITWKEYSFRAYNKVLSDAFNAKEPIYSGAYIMASGKSAYGYERKHENHLKLIEQILKSGLAQKIVEAKTMEEVYNNLLSFPTIGSFLAYQYTIDINYSTLTNFSEMDFVMPGPGARDGIRKCFKNLGDYSEADTIKLVTENQENEFYRLNLSFRNLWGRPLQLIDCQNIFCEVDKYSRVAHPEVESLSNRKRIKQKFLPKKHDIAYYYPPKWCINSNIIRKDEQVSKHIYQPSWER